MKIFAIFSTMERNIKNWSRKPLSWCMSLGWNDAFPRLSHSCSSPRWDKGKGSRASVSISTLPMPVSSLFHIKNSKAIFFKKQDLWKVTFWGCVLNFLVLFVYLLGYNWQCSGVTPVFAFRNYSWWGLSDHMISWGLNPGQLNTRQTTDLLYYCSSPFI